MNKPTVFFSHSSKDVDMLTAIKLKLNAITGGTLDIFLSSDGQSIPFGRNWVHRIEKGLQETKIMFVFITPNSVNSSWVYFEAGYIYSKDIRVIPVGIGVDISLLKAPLSLLQGFNISSSDGLNNIITIINKEFGDSFKEEFSEQDFTDINMLQNINTILFDPTSMLNSITFELFAKGSDGEGGVTTYDIDGFFNSLITLLVNKGFDYSQDNDDSFKTILVYGIKIIYELGKMNADTVLSSYRIMPKITLIISPYNFEKSFCLFLDICRLIANIKRIFVRISLRNEYTLIKKQEHLAAILSMYPNEFDFFKTKVGGFIFRDKDIRFSINEYKDESVLGISFKADTITFTDVLLLLQSLKAKGIIKHI